MPQRHLRNRGWRISDWFSHISHKTSLCVRLSLRNIMPAPKDVPVYPPSNGELPGIGEIMQTSGPKCLRGAATPKALENCCAGVALAGKSIQLSVRPYQDPSPVAKRICLSKSCIPLDIRGEVRCTTNRISSLFGFCDNQVLLHKVIRQPMTQSCCSTLELNRFRAVSGNDASVANIHLNDAVIFVSTDIPAGSPDILPQPGA